MTVPWELSYNLPCTHTLCGHTVPGQFGGQRRPRLTVGANYRKSQRCITATG